MNRRRRVVAEMVAVFVGAGAGFPLLQGATRHFEATSAAALVRLAGGRVHVVASTAIEVVPRGHLPFLAEVTPSCSSIGSLLALVCLGGLLRRGSKGLRALGAALVTVLFGNIVRIAASLEAGVLSGKASLVLFHDWVGSAFGLAYTLGGYLMLLHLVLPARPSAPGGAAAVPGAASASPAGLVEPAGR